MPNGPIIVQQWSITCCEDNGRPLLDHCRPWQNMIYDGLCMQWWPWYTMIWKWYFDQGIPNHGPQWPWYTMFWQLCQLLSMIYHCMSWSKHCLFIADHGGPWFDHVFNMVLQWSFCWRLFSFSLNKYITEYLFLTLNIYSFYHLLQKPKNKYYVLSLRKFSSKLLGSKHLNFKKRITALWWYDHCCFLTSVHHFLMSNSQ